MIVEVEIQQVRKPPPVAQEVTVVGRADIRFADQWQPWLLRVCRGAHRLQQPQPTVARVGVAGALDHVRNGVHAEAGHAALQPERHYPQQFLAYRRMGQVEVWLVPVEHVPVERAGLGIPCPDSGLDRREHRLQAVVRHVVAPQVPAAPGRVALLCGDEPLVRAGGVLHHQFDDDADAAQVGRIDQALEGGLVAQAWIDAVVIGDIVAAITAGVAVERQQPHMADAEPLQVVQLFGDAIQGAPAAALAVAEQIRVDLVDRAQRTHRHGASPALFTGDQPAVRRGSGS